MGRSPGRRRQLSEQRRYQKFVTAADIDAELSAPCLHRIEDVKASDGAPSEPGFYAWWAILGAIVGVPIKPHPSEPFGLLCVGIAPRDEASSARLRSRLCRQHIGGTISTSTLRLGLASLLWEQEGWTPRISVSGKFRLDREDNPVSRPVENWTTHAGRKLTHPAQVVQY